MKRLHAVQFELRNRHNSRSSKGLAVAKGSREGGENRAVKRFCMIHNCRYVLFLSSPIDGNTDVSPNVAHRL